MSEKVVPETQPPPAEQVGEEDQGEETVVTGPRQLTEREREALEKDTKLVPDFWRNKYEKEAGRNWDLFYKRNQANFFKDRHWTTREFQELLPENNGRGPEDKLVLFEVGCGVGNAFFPLLADIPSLYVNACDLSPRAIGLIKENPLYDASRCNAFSCDVTQDDVTTSVTPLSVDCATMIFVLSAIHPDKMPVAVANILKTIKPGGLVLVRDYGLYDNAMLRFKPGHKLGEKFYVRQDGTRAYYFDMDELSKLFQDAGCEVAECHYVHRRTVNKKEGVDVPRVYVQGKFRKPMQ